jgi:hypothetical protein
MTFLMLAGVVPLLLQPTLAAPRSASASETRELKANERMPFMVAG